MMVRNDKRWEPRMGRRETARRQVCPVLIEGKLRILREMISAIRRIRPLRLFCVHDVTFFYIDNLSLRPEKLRTFLITLFVLPPALFCYISLADTAPWQIDFWFPTIRPCLRIGSVTICHRFYWCFRTPNVCQCIFLVGNIMARFLRYG